MSAKSLAAILPRAHLTPASWACVQELFPLELAVQSMSTLSLAVHWTLSSHILPVPCPKVAWPSACTPDDTKIIDSNLHGDWNYSPVEDSPSCLQTTPASVVSHIWSHTVPHSLLRQISTRPSRLLVPPIRRTSPSVQPFKYQIEWYIYTSLLF